MGKNHEITGFGVVTIEEGDGGSTGSFSASFTDVPSLIVKLVSYRRGDPVHLRTTEISSSGFKAFAAEEQSADKELGYIAESINFLAFDSSSGSLDGSEYNATSSQIIL